MSGGIQPVGGVTTVVTSAGKTFTYVGSEAFQEYNTGSTVATPTGINVQTGDLIVVGVYVVSGSAATLSSGADTYTNTYSVITSNLNDNGGLFQWMWVIAGGNQTANKVTATFSGTSSKRKAIIVFVFRPSGGTPKKDINVFKQWAYQTNPTTGTGTTNASAGDHELCIIAVVDSGYVGYATVTIAGTAYDATPGLVTTSAYYYLSMASLIRTGGEAGMLGAGTVTTTTGKWLAADLLTFYWE